ncbi:MAG: DUF1592 domain-containing protein [Vicinamibacterales bacterium]
MTKTGWTAWAVVLGTALVVSGARASAQGTTSSDKDTTTHQQVIKRYCVGCHNERTKTAGLMLDQVDLDHVGQDPAVWEKVVRKLRTGLMPPDGRPRPDAATYTSLVSHLETALDKASGANPNPGWPAEVHRLNRAEYTNAIRDLLGLEVDGRALLPADDSGYGFDNIGDVLTVSPGLMARYMSAAAKISRRAVGDPTLRPGATMYKTSPLLLQEGRMSEDLPFGSRGGLAVRHHFPLDGEYLFKISLERPLNQPVSGTGHKLEFRLDHGLVKLFDFDTDEYKRAGSGAGVGGLLEVRLPVKAGARLVTASFIGRLDRSIPYDARPPNPPVASFQYSRVPINPIVFSIQVVGPYNGEVPVDNADAHSRQAIFICQPQTPADEDPCARDILRHLSRRAFRRPVTQADVEPLMASYRAGYQDDGGFEAGIKWALEALLVSPEFLLRVERHPGTVLPGTPYRVSDIDLASRLSFFLWSSIPDEALLALGEDGTLSDPDVLDQQVRRMLDDPRSSALTANFAGQWLYLRNLRTAAPNGLLFPTFDDNLREAFRRETELFFDSQVREDRSVLELLSADYTFLNDRLARHYDIPGVYGSHYRRVQYPDDRRAGLLGHGGILMVTSHPNRTSPVVRGKWLLENMLGSPPPPPPPDVPALAENDEGLESKTVRQRMEEHRANPVCAACHAKMDPLGFALENFDAVGQWREIDSQAGAPIDPSGALPDGTPFTTPAEFRAALLTEPWRSEFLNTVTEKLLTYAIGRGLEYYDAPAVREIAREADTVGSTWSSIVQGIVQSAPFQMRRMPDANAVIAQ